MSVLKGKDVLRMLMCSWDVMGKERTHVDITRGLATGGKLSVVIPNDATDTHPGSFSVLFIENAKCFPSDVKSSGL